MKTVMILLSSLVSLSAVANPKLVILPKMQEIRLAAGQSEVFYDYKTEQPVQVSCEGQNNKQHYCYCKFVQISMNYYRYELRRVDGARMERTIDTFGDEDEDKAACNAAITTHPVCK